MAALTNCDKSRQNNDLHINIKRKPRPDSSRLKMPRTGVEQSQILPRNQAIPQKALQSIQNWRTLWRTGRHYRPSINRLPEHVGLVQLRDRHGEGPPISRWL
jgi:hypothetical protein